MSGWFFWQIYDRVSAQGFRSKTGEGQDWLEFIPKL
jgi:hypothetical protein